MKHTPAPWTVDTSAHRLVLGNNGETVIAETFKDPQFTFDRGVSRSEAEANANLIGAAPELLDALEGLLKEIDLGKYNIRKDFGLFVAHNQALHAIAKAKNEE